MALRRLEVLDPHDYFPAYVVWELTLRCDQPCAHCGSRAGKPRPDELSTAKALEVVDELKALRVREVVLIGGEAYLHDGFLDIIAALRAAGIRPSMTTGGRGIDPRLAAQMKAAGLHTVSVSVDGLEAEHDAIRLAKGSYRGAISALRALKEAGLFIAANTNINRVNRHVLEDLFKVLAGLGIGAWQVQITVPLGRAADRPQMLLQPWDLIDLVPRLAALKQRAFARNIRLMPGNNLGYFGPEEALMRSLHRGGRDHWQGCQAGRRVMGIESDGAVKGCPSLQTSHYVGGNLKRTPLQRIWEEAPALAFTRARDIDALWGFCRDCAYAATCMGGCSFTAHALFGRPGNNPYCHFRALAFRKLGQRERLVPKAAARGLPFDHGLYEIQLEDFDDDDEVPSAHRDLVQITRKPDRFAASPD